MFNMFTVDIEYFTEIASLGILYIIVKHNIYIKCPIDPNLTSTLI